MFFGVGGGEEVGFELGGGEIDSAIEHGLEVFGIALGVGCGGGIVVGNIAVLEEQGEH